MKDRNINYDLNTVLFKDSVQSAIIPKNAIKGNIVGATKSIESKSTNHAIRSNPTDSNTSSNQLLLASKNSKEALAKETLEVDLTFSGIDSKMDFLTSSLTDATSSQPKLSHQSHIDQVFEEFEKIPDRMGFKIGEVAFLTGVKSYILRYWESEFEALKPKKANNNMRIYTQKDVRIILLIKKLLYKDKYSIEGAKKALKSLQSEVRDQRKTLLLSQQQQKAMELLKDLIGQISSLKKDMEFAVSG